MDIISWCLNYNRGLRNSASAPKALVSLPLFIDQKESEMHWQSTVKTCPSNSTDRWSTMGSLLLFYISLYFVPFFKKKKQSFDITSLILGELSSCMSSCTLVGANPCPVSFYHQSISSKEAQMTALWQWGWPICAWNCMLVTKVAYYDNIYLTEWSKETTCPDQE